MSNSNRHYSYNVWKACTTCYEVYVAATFNVVAWKRYQMFCHELHLILHQNLGKNKIEDIQTKNSVFVHQHDKHKISSCVLSSSDI